MRFLGFINRLFEKKISSKGLAVFRICFALNLFFEVNRIFRYRHLYFDPLPYIKEASFDFTIPLLLWMLVLLMLVFGLFTRYAAIANYIFCVWILNYYSSTFEYHMDYTYLGVGFLMIFIPLAQSYSLDSLLKKIKLSNTKALYHIEEKTTVLNYFLIILVGVGLVYFGSIFYKFNSNAWLNGLGIWLPASIPQVTIFNDQFLLNQEYLMKFLGYTALFFEIVFPFTFFIKKLRPYLLLIGVIMHVGIMLEFPIPFFALGYIAIYLLMIPVRFWEKLEKKLQFKSSKLQFFYDAECPLCVRTKIIISHFDIFKAIDFKSVQEYAQKTEALKSYNYDTLLNDIHSVNNKGQVFSGVNTYKQVSKYIPFFYGIAILFHIPGVSFIANKIYAYIAKNRGTERCTEENCNINFNNKETKSFLSRYSFTKQQRILGFKLVFFLVLLLQINVLPGEKYLRQVKNKVQIMEKPMMGVLVMKRYLKEYSGLLLGITGHGVFVDGHYVGFDKIYGIKYKNEFLPLYDEKGMPDTYLKSGVWANYNFRVNMPNVKLRLGILKRGLKRYAAFWAYQNDIDLNNAEFTLVMKKVRVNFEWEEDLLKENLANPWETVGKIIWQDKQAQVILNTIE